MQSYTSPADLESGIAALIAREPRFAAVLLRHGTPSLRATSGGFESLLMIVVEQFLSLAAASAIWARVRKEMETVTARKILNRSDAQLLALGLSNAKVRTFKAVAAARIDFEALHACDDAVIHKVLCALPGIGPWTADIYLLSCLGRCDAWPSGDLALQIAAQNLLSLETRPTLRELNGLAEPWRPHRAAAARLLWSHYREIKGLRQA
jgi:DNA-3-methyladenine glycosylase II